MKLHTFNESLAYSHAQADQDYWELIYRKAFPDFHSMIDLRHDGWHQRAGRDRAVILNSGKQIFIDEKARTAAAKPYNDMLVEVWSIYPKNNCEVPYKPRAGTKPGWACEPKDCDWLAYAFEPIHTCYMFPFLGIRAAWAKQASNWIRLATTREQGFKWVRAENQNYFTISIAVPMWIFQEAITDALTINWRSR